VNIFDIGYVLAAAVTAPWWMRKSRSGWAERFARVVPDISPRVPGRSRVMLHAVSVGEVNALRELVPMLAVEAEVVVTASTDTGLARARDLFGGVCEVARFPLDASWAVRRFLAAVEPDVVGLVELELWPNFLRECGRRAVPVAVINGRLSARSFKGYWRVRRWISPSFASLAVAAVQDETYAGRFHAMGVPRERVVVSGSMKFDNARIEDDVEGAETLASDLGIDRARPLVVAGSTGPGEEALIFGACVRAFGEGGVQLLCAPRKTERFEEAARALPGCIRRTERARTTDETLAQSPASSSGVEDPPSLFLLDTIGELRMAYALADVVVVGRSFFDLYGSDPIEPIGLGKATILGPAMSDFAEITRALEDAGGLIRADRSTLSETLESVMGDSALRAGLAWRGRGCVQSLQGASARHAELLLWLAGSGEGDRPELTQYGQSASPARD
jgi:3-deoxy-D-manno-octulosonic-acid transferase